MDIIYSKTKNLENVVYIITFLVRLFSVAGYLKRSNKRPTSI